jgi:cytoskeleton protein RodZ
MALLQSGRPPFADEASGPTAPLVPGLHSAGELLRQRREALGLDLGGVAASLRIKPAYLVALEEGRHDELPGPVYAIGFMRAYAEHLGLDGEEVLRRFKRESTGLSARPGLSFPMPLAERSMPGGGMLLFAAILAICGYGAWYYLSIGERSRPERVVEVPAALLPPKPEAAIPHPTEAIAAPSAAAPAEESTASPARQAAAPPGAANAATPQVIEAVAAPEPSLQSGSGTPAGPPQIVLHATADSWVQIRDGSRAMLLARILKSGESYRVPEGAGLSMLTGNAGGLEITVNGNPVPSIGPTGGVRRNVALDPQALIAGTAVRD